MYNQQLADAIQLGLRRGYNQYKQFGEDYTGFELKMTEYILSVFVSIEMNNFNFGFPFKINVEYPLWRFYMEAYPRVKWIEKKDLFDASEYIRREYTRAQTKHRMDICVFKNEADNWLSLHGIELKAINTSYAEVKNDLNRLSDSMITTDITGDSAIASCYSGFIKTYKNDGTPVTALELTAMRNDKLQHIENFLNNDFRGKPEYVGLSYEVCHTDINSVAMETYLDGWPEEDMPDYADVAANTGEVLGVVIEISRKP